MSATPQRLAIILSTILAAMGAGAACAADPWDAAVRGTEARTPAEEQAGFKLPPGFVIELVASEPTIAKPLNLAFDARGRLWVTSTREYPFPAEPGKGRDTIIVLDDGDGDGTWAATTFADGLNIPIGLQPYGTGAIAHSIPKISYYQDTDGDGRCDRVDALYGDVATRDTHGMVNSFRRGFDGWLYACHGFSNDSTLVGGDGQKLRMVSGNTFRMRVDGSHVESWTRGLINPFGMAFDPAGNLYVSDCHTKPIHQLLSRGHYSSWSAQPDGLGHAPEMMQHSHESTGLCGIAYYAADAFPAEFRDNFFLCNVVTSRINRDTIENHGSTRLAREAPDFLTSDDPWFRPVDLQVGPDGALYVADFYNRIIGHYEVDLKHPQRDRERGRIWRISWRGDAATPPAAPRRRPDLAAADAAALIAALGEPNLTVRMLAADQLCDRVGAPAAAPVTALLRGGSANVHQRVHGLWVLQRLGALDAGLLAAAAGDAQAVVRAQAMAIAAVTAEWSDAQAALVVAALGDADALVRRHAADALGLHPQVPRLRPLLDLLAEVPDDDTHLKYKVRQAVRDQLLRPGNLAALAASGLSPAEGAVVAAMALAVPSPEAASFLLARLRQARGDRAADIAAMRHIASHLPEADLPAFVDTARALFADDTAQQFELLRALQTASAQRGIALGPAVGAWARQLVAAVLDGFDPDSVAWTPMPLPGKPASGSADPWEVQNRDSADGQKGKPFLSSLPKGEKLTGVLRSRPFMVPARLVFHLAGHNGPPGEHPVKNVVRLRAADDHRVLIEVAPPRADPAQRVEWDLAAHQGRSAYLELVDGDDAGGYAWLAIGRFEPAVIELGDGRLPLIRAALDGARELKSPDLAPGLGKLLAAPRLAADLRALAGEALLAAGPEHAALAAAVVADALAPDALRERLAVALAGLDAPAVSAALTSTLAAGSHAFQVKLAMALAGNRAGAAALLGAIGAGTVSPRLLQERAVAERLNGLDPAHGATIARLTAGLPAVSAERERLLRESLEAFNAARPQLGAASLDSGRTLFAVSCGTCHRLGGQGALIGPQLDGIGNRGIERLLEDVLDPSRNVDVAFRQTLFTLRDGQVVAGFLRREEGETVVVADITGKENVLAKSAIAQRAELPSSLMPDTVTQTLTPEEINDLLWFLLAQRKE